MSIKQPNLEALLHGAGIEAYGTEKVYGVAPAVVIKLKDEAAGRHMMQAVQVWFPWLQPKDDPNLIAPWARVVSFAASTDSGWISTPQVGDEVLCGFEYGDITHPYVLGQLWNGKRKIPDPKPGGTSSGSASGSMSSAAGGGGGAGGAGAGGEGREGPAGGGAGPQQNAQQAGQGGAAGAGAAGGGAGAGAAGGAGGAGKPGVAFARQKGRSKGKGGALGLVSPAERRPLQGLANARAGLGAALSFLNNLRNTDFGKPLPPPPPPPPPPLKLELVGLRTHATARDWLTYHHPLFFVEIRITGNIQSVTLDITPKRQPVAMMSVWEPVASGNPRAKSLLLGAVGDPCRKPNCPHAPGSHRSGWWSRVPNWTSGRITVNTGGRKVLTLGVYPRYSGTFVVKAWSGPTKSNAVTLTMQGHPRPGD